MLIIDCGACIGEFFNSYLNPNNEIYAFEPNLINFRYLQSHYPHSYVKLLNVAVGTENTETRFYQFDNQNRPGNQGCSFYADKDNVDPEEWDVVEVIKLSEFIKQFEHIDILKLDIEGAEFAVVRDLMKENVVDRIDKVIIEWHDNIPSAFDPTVRDDFKRLYSHKYVEWH